MGALQANTEPLPGYCLIEPLGKGGFGEVWKCEAPGGLLKAIKIVAGKGLHLGDNAGGADQELRALQHVKSIRHPFLLSMDRIEVVDGDLLIVMELADHSLHDLLGEYRQNGQRGIPRDELLGYLREAAEVLDLMNQQHQLQHLDIKPRNLFLLNRHVKVADFGLVNRVPEVTGNAPAELQFNPVTPAYAAPENFHGQISQACDQYSLAIAYHEMLTGKRPFGGKNFRQLALQHVQVAPDLSALPEGDRPAVARALAKKPEERFPSCGAFVQALTHGPTVATGLPGPSQVFSVPDRAAPATTKETEGDPPHRDTKKVRALLTVEQPVVRTASTGSEFADLKLLECLSRQPSELWRGLAPDGGKRRIRFLVAADGESLTRLAQLQHRYLAKVEVMHPSPNQIYLVTEAGEENLVTRLRECTKAGVTGVPRHEILDYLADVADALDELCESDDLHHLTLSPRTVALVDGKARLIDFGLAELLWLPAGQQPGALNIRYGAPELFDGVITRHADQYSLALVFHEITTGTHAFRHVNTRQMASARQRGAPDLGLLPTTDRELLLRALNPDPELRFPSCSAFIDALMAAGEKTRAPAPTVQTVAPTTSVTSARVVNELLTLASEGRVVRQHGDISYLLEPGRSILHQCWASLVRGMVRVRLHNFRDQWKAQEVKGTKEERFLFHLPLPATFWQRTLGRSPRLAVEVCNSYPTDDRNALTETSIRIWTEACNYQQAVKVLDDLGPRLLESLRACLNVAPDQRGQVRIPYTRPVMVAPVIDGKLGEPIESVTKNVAQSGMCVSMPCALPAAEVCVLVPLPSHPEPAPIEARVVWVRTQEDGRVEVGLKFK
jgi:serine/threonine protein kinase